MSDSKVMAVVAAPAQQEMTAEALGPGLSALQGRKRFLIKQRFEAMESLAQMTGLPGVANIETANKYDVFDADTGEPIMFVQEESTCLYRYCCAPFHEAKIHVFDVRPENQPGAHMMTGMKPFKCGFCPAAADLCQDEINVVDSAGNPIGGIKEPIGGGGFTPVLDILDSKGQAQASVKGPTCCVGGLIELCGEVNFTIHEGAGGSGKQVGTLQKVKPAGLQEAMKEAVGDADTFLLTVPESASMEEVANLIMSNILVDFSFFEGGAPFELDIINQSIHVNCANLYCFGCLTPCRCTLGGGNN